MSAQPNEDTYVLGRSEPEEQRLRLQAVFHEPATRRLFDAAGIGPGMKVLDLGSGAGDVAMLVATMVGPTGSVVGVDMNPVILETARRRVKAAGHANITFVAGDLREVPLDRDFDAIVGRYILMYLSDPAAILRHLLPHLRPAGVVAFYELDCTIPGMAYPPSPLTERVYAWITGAGAYGGAETSMGMKLYQVFLDAGLEAPQMTTESVTGGSRAHIEGYTAYASEAVRSLLPLLIKAGIATEEEVGIETLAVRWRDEVLEQGGMLRDYLCMGAWARKT